MVYIHGDHPSEQPGKFKGFDIAQGRKVREFSKFRGAGKLWFACGALPQLPKSQN